MAWIEERPSKNGKRYFVYSRVGGKRVCYRAGTNYKIAVTLKDKLDCGEIVKENNLSGPAMTLELAKQAYETYSSRTKKERSVKKIATSLKVFLSFFEKEKPIASVSIEDIGRFKNWYLEGHKKNGLLSVLVQVKAFFNYAMSPEQGWISSNPAKTSMAKLKWDKVEHYIDDHKVHALLEACSKVGKNIHKASLIALYTGMRMSGILDIRHERYFFRNEKGENGETVKNSYLTIPHEKTGPRAIPVHPVLVPLFEERKNGPMFEGYDRNCLERDFRRAKRSRTVHLEEFRFHDFRHMFCSNYLRNGGTTTDLMKITGHMNIVSLERYTHFQCSHLAQKVKNVDYGEKFKFEVAV